MFRLAISCCHPGIARSAISGTQESRLERSAITIKQLAFVLGFKDAAYFNRFFAHQMGTPPARYRRDNTQHAAAGRAPQVSLTFADWP